MEKQKAINLVGVWKLDEAGVYGYYTHIVKDFIDWLYVNGFTIGTKFQGEDLKKQEEL